MQGKQALAGIRVTDFTWYMAGPQATRILADFGAEIIKVESREPYLYRLTGPWRKNGVRLQDRSQVDSPNLSGTWNNHYRNKLSVTVDVKKPQGMEIIRKLISLSDIVIENFSSRVLESWGLSYEEMKQIREDIIYISMAGMGHWGPDRDVQTMGPIVQALSGLTYMSGFPDLPPAGWGYSYMDHTGGYFGAIAALSALYHREQTGKGQWVDLAQVEAAANLVGTAILQYNVLGKPANRNGNRLDHPAAAPHSIYPCQGVDKWIAISVFNEQEWRALCAAMGHPEFEKDSRFQTHLGRVTHQNELDALISNWTRTMDRYEAMELLQGHGVAAGAVQSGVDRFERDPQLQERGIWVQIEHPEQGLCWFEGMPAHLSDTPATFHRSAPCLGQHNDYILGEILGLSKAELEELARDEVI